MLKFPNTPPTLLLKEPFLKSTTLSKLKHRQLWLVKLLGWIALWMLNFKDSQGVQVRKSSLEEEASSVVLVPGEPLLLLFYYVLCGLQRAQHLPYSETVRRRTVCFRQLLRTGKARVSSDDHWENSGSGPTNSSLLLKTTEDRTVTLYSCFKTLCFLHLPTSHGVCRRWGIGEDYAHVARSTFLGSRLPQTIPSDNSWYRIVLGGVSFRMFSGTFYNRRVSCVGAHNPQSNFLLTLSRQCVVHFCL